MIDIRYNLYLAHKKDVIGKMAKRALAKVAKETYFPHRNYAHTIEDARGRYPQFSDEIDSFGDYIASNRKSLKEIDAMMLVKFLKERYESMTRESSSLG
jgi:hypothetical protein